MSSPHPVRLWQEVTASGSAATLTDSTVRIPGHGDVQLVVVYHTGTTTTESTSVAGRVGTNGATEANSPVFGTWAQIAAVTTDRRFEVWLGYGFPDWSPSLTGTVMRVENVLPTTAARAMYMAQFALGGNPITGSPVVEAPAAVTGTAVTTITSPALAAAAGDLLWASSFAAANVSTSSVSSSPTSDAWVLLTTLTGTTSRYPVSKSPSNQATSYTRTWNWSAGQNVVAFALRLRPPAPPATPPARYLYKGRDTQIADQGAAA